MEHIVQFGISIDDSYIKQQVEDSAKKQIIDGIKQDVCNKLFTAYYRTNATPNDPLSSFSINIINEFLEKNKEVILEKAAEHLADKLSRTKAGKALLEKETKNAE